MFEAIFEILFEFVGEFLLQMLGELFSGMFRSGVKKSAPLVSASAARRAAKGKSSNASEMPAVNGVVPTPSGGGTSPLREIAWSVGMGAVCGLITVWFFPVMVIRDPSIRMINLVVSPLLAGFLVERVRAVREAKGGPARSPDLSVMGYAAVFGFVFALMRFLFTR